MFHKCFTEVQDDQERKMRQGRFNTDSVALQNRLTAHDKFAKKELNDWLFELLTPQSGHQILDLGCGTGKQSLALAEIVGENRHIVSVDISAESLETLNHTATQRGLAERITTYHRDLDAFGEGFEDESFDRAVASFSLYYAEDSDAVISAVSRVLKRGGLFVFCGPTSTNNLELKDFISKLPGKVSYDATVIPSFMEKIGPAIVKDHFSKVETFRFDNPIEFDSPDTLYAYWSSHNLYEASLDVDFRQAAAEHFANHSVFANEKRVVGIRATKL